MTQAILEFPPDAVWLNSQKPLLFARELKGHVILLHFWTRWCIHCLHTLREIEILHARFANTPLVTIGIHANKYAGEPLSGLRAAIDRYHIRHPVVSAARIWEDYGITMWPTFMLISATGELIGSLSGEGHLKLLEHNIQRALDHAASANIPAAPLPPITPSTTPDTPLRFPTRILVDQNKIAIVDSAHHRILVGELHGHALRITHTIGAGQPGNTDGPFHTASFNAPQGAALRNDILYIADTSNHLVRRADLRTQTVTTLLGTGEKTFDHEAGKSGREQPLNSPWDLAIHAGGANRLYIAQAGQHQLFAMNLMTNATEVAAGTAREDLHDGPALHANLAQPSALALDPQSQTLYFLDAQSSALRALDLKSKTVTTLIGRGGGLFTFGDTDGPLDQARLTHPLALTFQPPNTLYLADTANHKIKKVDLATQTIQTLPIPTQQNEPAGLATISADELLIADTTNHRIVHHNTTTNSSHELTLIF
jgi:sugar lactone lactonase YvrE/thiol-disulfide isomerase/thioredoxin